MVGRRKRRKRGVGDVRGQREELEFVCLVSGLYIPRRALLS